MVRFTERDEHGDLYVKEHDYISASKKLAEYEDTGLTPEQIIQMERENIKLNITIVLKMLRIGVKQPKNKTSG